MMLVIRILSLMLSLKPLHLEKRQMMKNEVLKGNVASTGQKYPLSPKTLASQPVYTTDTEWGEAYKHHYI